MSLAHDTVCIQIQDCMPYCKKGVVVNFNGMDCASTWVPDDPKYAIT